MFKTRYKKHMYDFRTTSEDNSTTLSKHIWSLKRENAPYDLSWEIISRARVFNPVTKCCQLCLREKYWIMFHPESATLNRLDDLFNTCKQRIKCYLANWKLIEVIIFSFWKWNIVIILFLKFICKCKSSSTYHSKVILYSSWNILIWLLFSWKNSI